jgi:hypothetical protein
MPTVRLARTAARSACVLSRLQTANPLPETLVGVIEGSPEQESEWHLAFRYKCVKGEWFELTEEDVASCMTASASTTCPTTTGSPDSWAAVLRCLRDAEPVSLLRGRTPARLNAGFPWFSARSWLAGCHYSVTPPLPFSVGPAHTRLAAVAGLASIRTCAVVVRGRPRAARRTAGAG